VQEARAKRKLDQITLLTRPTVTVVREGRARPIDPSELVTGDLLQIGAGDQVAADGLVVGEGRLEVDESLLTGESDLVPKRAGDRLLSGSFCATGRGLYEAERVGAASYANQLTESAREFKVVKTPLQRKIDLAVRLVTVVVFLVSLAILLQARLDDLAFDRVVKISAVLTGLVPYGLFFVTAVSYSLGAAALAKRGALVQQVNAIESLSNVDVLCVDKTGTLTANRFHLHGVHALDGADEVAVRRRLGEFARSSSVANATSLALADGLDAEGHPVADEIAFAPSRGWSALAFHEGDGRGVWALGAVDSLAPFLADGSADEGSPLAGHAATWSGRGLSVLLFAHADGATRLHDEAGAPGLPTLVPAAVVALEDELRPEARETLAEFVALGISPKIVSGDDPRTVAAVARQAGLPADLRSASGPDLEAMSPEEFDRAASEVTAFGRLSPRQKERLVASLTRQGHYVGMMGDGVNDTLALKQAKLGIAMEGGSSVTRNVADMVLLGDSFASLRPAITEGRRIAAGLSNAMYLFLTRVAVSTLMILTIAVVGLGFPYEPAQVALTLFTVGIPSIALTLWARADAPRPDLLRSLTRFVLPAAVVTAIFGTAIYTISYEVVLDAVRTAAFPREVLETYEDYTGLPFERKGRFGTAAATIEAQTMLSLFVSYTAFVLILFLEPPFRLFTAWRPLSPDRRPALLAVGLFVVFTVVTSIPVLAGQFGLVTVGTIQHIILATGAVLWFITLSLVWRARVFDRLFSMKEPEERAEGPGSADLTPGAVS
jgi:cation-transporting ATPase E